MTYPAPDPASEAEVARLVLHELSLATRVIADPADSYAILASLASAMGSLQQVLTQLADTHDRKAEHVTDPTGDRTAGRHAATAAAAGLRDSAAHLATATGALNEAWARNGQLNWAPTNPPLTTPPHTRPTRSRAAATGIDFGR